MYTYIQRIVALAKKWKRDRYWNFPGTAVIIWWINMVAFVHSKRIKIRKTEGVQDYNFTPYEKQKRYNMYSKAHVQIQML